MTGRRAGSPLKQMRTDRLWMRASTPALAEAAMESLHSGLPVELDLASAEAIAEVVGA